MKSPMKRAISSCIWRSAGWLCSVLWHGSGEGVYAIDVGQVTGAQSLTGLGHVLCIENLTLKDQTIQEWSACVGGQSEKI